MKFSNEIIEKVWQTGKIVEGVDSKMIRKDPCGAWIVRDKYGMPDNDYGWDIEFIYPVALGGDDNLKNLRATHCANIKSKGNSYPSYIVAVSSDGQINVPVRKVLKVNKTKREMLKTIYKIEK